MGQQYHIQYGLPYVCLRASWIMHDEMIFRTLLKKDEENKKRTRGDPDPPRRYAVDPPCRRHRRCRGGVSAGAGKNPASVGQTFNIAAASAFSYDVAGKYLAEKISLPMTRIKVSEAHDFQIDISKARKYSGLYTEGRHLQYHRYGPEISKCSLSPGTQEYLCSP